MSKHIASDIIIGDLHTYVWVVARDSRIVEDQNQLLYTMKVLGSSILTKQVEGPIMKVYI